LAIERETALPIGPRANRRIDHARPVREVDIAFGHYRFPIIWRWTKEIAFVCFR